MEFELTEEQRLVKRMVRRFADEVIRPAAEEHDEGCKYPLEIIKEAAKLNLIGPTIPEEYGGAGLDHLSRAIITEELFRGDPGIGSAITSRDFGTNMLLEYGSEEQKREYLPPIAKGEAVSGSAITEPEAGSDVANIKTSAEHHGGYYVLNGSKIFITNGSIADFLIVLARTEMHPPKRHEGLSAFIVETDREGFEARPIKNKLGIRASDLAEITLADVRVPEENLIGEEDQAFYQLMSFFACGRVGVAAQAVGIAQGAFDEALRYSKERVQFGHSICEFQAIQFKLADMAIEIEAARLLTYKAASLIDRGGNPALEASMAKLFASKTAMWVTNEALQIHGGYGFIKDYPVERFFRDAKITELYEGTSEIQHLIIARALLGRISRQGGRK